jgi:hypothetical protein
VTASTTPAPPTAKKVPPKAVKKDVKSLMKGVVVKKKPKPLTAGSAGGEAKAGLKRPAEDSGPEKKQKLSDPW